MARSPNFLSVERQASRLAASQCAGGRPRVADGDRDPEAPPLQITTFLLTSAAILLTPGPTNTILAASGAAMGLRQARLLPLAEMRADPELVELMMLRRGSRLSITPVTSSDWRHILSLLG